MKMRAAATLALISGCAALAGPLNPPGGPVTSTYKTLSEVEPRTPVGAATPGTGTAVYSITQPGSYYLTGNISVFTARCAIEIAASDVTLDLNGYTISGIATALDGIRTTGSARTQITIRNGTVAYFGGEGVNLTNGGIGTGCTLEKVTVSHNGGTGIDAGKESVVKDCRATDNGSRGILASENSRVEGCTALRSGAWGIFTGSGCIIRSCVSSHNQNDGIEAGTGCAISECDCWFNGSSGFSSSFSTITDCVASYNTGEGIYAYNGTQVSRCTSTYNGANGIRVMVNSLVLNNVCAHNGLSQADGAGIRVEGAHARIEGNNCTDQARGICATGTNSMFIRNSCGQNTANYAITAGNNIYVVSAPTGGAINGNSGGAPFGGGDPNANFAF